MKKIWLVLSILTASLCARENPFMPISELNTSVMTTNVVEKYDSFNSLSFKFPSDAMLLLDVTIRYRANDGSIKEKRLTDINKTIDWNDEFALSKMKNPEPVAAKKLDVSVTMAEVPAQKVSTPVIIEKNETKISNKDRNKTSDVPTPNVVVIDLGTKKAKEPAKPEQKVVEVKIEPASKPVQEIKSSEKEVKFLGFVSFLAHEKELNIITKAKNLKIYPIFYLSPLFFSPYYIFYSCSIYITIFTYKFIEFIKFVSKFCNSSILVTIYIFQYTTIETFKVFIFFYRRII